MDFAQSLEMELDTVAETRLWQAVVLSAVQDWVFGALRVQREAEAYIFDDSVDFPRVCESAGMNVEHLRTRLRKLRDDPSRN